MAPIYYMHDISHLVDQLLTGYRIIYTDIDYAPIVLGRGFTSEERIIQKIEFDKAMLEASSVGIPTEEELLVCTEKTGAWGPGNEITIQIHAANIEKTKEEISRYKYKKLFQKKLQKRLARIQDERNKLLNRKNSLLSGSAECWAQQKSLYWNIHNVFYTLDKKPIWNTRTSFEDTDKEIIDKFIGAYLGQFVISQQRIREIARSGQWSIFYSECSDPTTLFGRRISELDSNQINILFWSSVYENARKAYEPPTDKIINDDILFDAWSSEQHREYLKSVRQRKIDKSVKNKSKASGTSKVIENFVFTDEQGAKEFYEEVN